jgi:hypothetical protein
MNRNAHIALDLEPDVFEMYLVDARREFSREYVYAMCIAAAERNLDSHMLVMSRVFDTNQLNEILIECIQCRVFRLKNEKLLQALTRRLNRE